MYSVYKHKLECICDILQNSYTRFQYELIFKFLRKFNLANFKIVN